MTRVETPQSSCLFGLSIRDITPPVGIYHRMWGAARHDRSTGIHRPLQASALAFSDRSGETRRVIVALDHCLLMRREMEQLLERLETSGAVRRDELVVTFSHTHAAGLLDPGRSHLPGGDLIAPYLEKLTDVLVESTREALGSLQPATITYATGHCSLAAHRDLFDEENGLYVCGFDPASAADDTVLTARVTDADDGMIATIVNYACHPTTLAWQNERISPDYPGAMRDVIAAATGAPCVFLQGASGELGPQNGFVGDVEVADRNGRQLGHAALESLESTPPPGTVFEYAGPVVSGATIGTWMHRDLDAGGLERARRFNTDSAEVELPYRDDLATVEETARRLEEHRGAERAATESGDKEGAAEARALAERMTRQATRLDQLPPGETYPYRASIWRLGNSIWVAVEGEPYSFLQTELRRRFEDTTIVVITLDRGWGPCYLPKAEVYGKGVYQESASVLARGSLETLVDELSLRVGRLLESC